METKKKVLAIAAAASAKKAIDIVTMDMRKIPTIADYFVITSGTSTTHVKAIADNIAKELKKKHERLWHSEGEREALWILLDYSDVVVHIFFEDTRRFYDLERLWSDVPQKHYKEVIKGRSKSYGSKKKKRVSKS